MQVKLLSKSITQQLLRDMRKAGYTVTKPQNGIYECHEGDELLFRALNGTRGYLVRFKEGLITEVKA